MKRTAYVASVLAIVAAAGLGASDRLVSRATQAVLAPANPPSPATSKPKAYLAGPLGFSEAGNSFYRGTLLPLVEQAGFEPLDPWKLTPQALIDPILSLQSWDARRARWQEVNPIIGRNNAEAIKRCDLVVAVLDGSDVDSGTASEIGYAAALGKTILGYRNDFRLAGDNEGAVVNLQVEYFIRQNGGDIVTSICKLRERLLKLRTRLPRRTEAG